MNVHYCVSGSIDSDDPTFLDGLEAELPAPDEVRLANEFTSERVELDDGSERLSARMTFERGLQGKAAAEYLFERVSTHDLAALAEDYTVRLYQTPEGAVTPDEVREWYEAHPDAQPTDEDSEQYLPETWDPEGHVVSEVSEVSA